MNSRKVLLLVALALVSLSARAGLSTMAQANRAFHLALAMVSPPAYVADVNTASSPTPASIAFNRLKTLVGTWEADTPMGKARTSYELISGGSVLLERITLQGMHEGMITTYNLNNDRLELTHFCDLGNQPHMIARNINLDKGEIYFDFAGASNLASPNAAHMHTAKFHLLDNDHFTSEWTLFENSKPKQTVTLQYARVK